MEHLHIFRADWNYKEISELELQGIRIDENGIFQIQSNKKAVKIFRKFEGAKNFYHRKAKAVFSMKELSVDTLMLCNTGPNMVNSAQFNTDDDGYDYLRFAFGEICKSCNNIPKGEQIKPITLAKEPKLSKKYIWGSFNGVSGYLFTDKSRYKLLKDKWGLKSIDLLIGKNQKPSDNFVQLDIPISNSALCFGDSNFGNTFKIDGSGQISESIINCDECNRSLYTNQLLDYFPSFKEQHKFDIVFTQEWFGWYRRVILNKDFAKWLNENNFIKFDSDYLVPIKKFCK